MKTIQELTNRRTKACESIERIGRKDTETSRDRRDLKGLKAEVYAIDQAIRCVETSPDEAFLCSQLATYEGQLKALDERFRMREVPRDRKFKDAAAIRTFYNKQMGVPRLRDYVKTLKFLLN